MPLRKIKAADVKTLEAIALDPNAAGRTYRKSRPVFKITFNNNEVLIVKAEVLGGKAAVVAQKSAAFGGMIMEAVSPEIKVENLSSDEIADLAAVPQGSYLPANKKEVAHSYLTDLLKETRIFFMIKMAFVENLRSADDKLKKKNADETDEKVVERAKKLVTKLSTQPAMEALGKIIAADFFIGNHDRFGPSGEVVNIGNIVFEKLGDKSYKPVGLDFWDAQGENVNLAQSVALKNWAGIKLANRRSQGELAVAIIQGLNEAIRGLVPGIKAADLLDQTRCGAWLVGGLEAGCQALKTKLQAIEAEKGSLPGGVRPRVEALKW